MNDLDHLSIIELKAMTFDHSERIQISKQAIDLLRAQIIKKQKREIQDTDEQTESSD